jgi:nicotinamidase/pyrazinamidase
MPGVIFWDVDTQYDFMHADGKLYVPGAEQLIPNLGALNQHAHQVGIRIVASADDHVAEHAEISDEPDYVETFPPHCIRGSRGQQKIPETTLRNPLLIEPTREDPAALKNRVREHDGDLLFHKHRFDVFSNPNVQPVLEELDPHVVVVYGVALDVCNRYAIEGLLARCPSTMMHLVTDATKPIQVNHADRLLTEWQSRGVGLISTAEALGMNPNSTKGPKRR